MESLAGQLRSISLTPLRSLRSLAFGDLLEAVASASSLENGKHSRNHYNNKESWVNTKKNK